MTRSSTTDSPSTEQWHRLKDLVAACLDLAPGERAAFLAQAAADDESVRRRAARLVFQDETDLALWDQPLLFHLAEPGDPAPPTPLPELAGLTWIKPLGAGGMGDVYLAERYDGAYRSKVAVKILKPGPIGADLEQRFRRERFILHQLSHPNIARFYEGGTLDDGRPYYVMEYIDGLPITDYCHTHQLTLTARLRLFVTLCRAVHEAHRHLIIHRDIKPGNILVTAQGEPKLLDFGIAKLASDPSLTQTGARFFTPRYASPEQVRGDHLTTANDVYSLGLLLYELLTGVCPENPNLVNGVIDTDFRFTKPSNALPLVDPDAATPFAADQRARRLWRRALRGDLDTIVLFAVRPDPKQRYASADQLGDDLENFLAGRPVRAQPDAPLYLLGKFIKRHRYAVGAAVTAFALMAVALVVLTHQQQLLERERQAAVAGRMAAEREREHADAVSRLMSESFMNADPYQNQGEPETLLTTYTRLQRRLTQDEALKPLVRADLCFQLGMVLNHWGHYDDALALLERSLALRQAHDAAPSDLAAGHEALASLALARGHYGRSMDRYDQAFRIYPPADAGTALAAAGNRLRVAISHNLVRNFGAAQAALAESRIALASAPQHATGVHEITAYYHLETSHALLGQGLVDGVARHLADAAAHETRMPQRHAGLQAQIDLQRATLMRLQGRLSQAATLLTELENRYRQLFGPRHWRSAQVYEEAALCHWAMNQEVEAAEDHNQAVACYRHSFGPYHPATLRSHLLKARYWQDAGDFTAALAETSRHIQAAARETDGDLALLVPLLVRQGSDLYWLGERRKAVDLINRYLPALQARLPANHAGRLGLERTLAAALTDLGETDRAAAVFDRHERIAPQTTFTRCATAVGRAALALKVGRHEACQAQLAAVRNQWGDLTGPDRAHLCADLNRVAADLALQQNRPEHALDLLAAVPPQSHGGGGLDLAALHRRGLRLKALVAAGRQDKARREAQSLQAVIDSGLERSLPLHRELSALVGEILATGVSRRR